MYFINIKFSVTIHDRAVVRWTLVKEIDTSYSLQRCFKQTSRPNSYKCYEGSVEIHLFSTITSPVRLRKARNVSLAITYMLEPPHQNYQGGPFTFH